ncbi:hypothetical protein CHUAL_003187 [Chamberlinius hualienensis]
MKAPIMFLTMVICFCMALAYGQMQIEGGGGERSPDSVIDPACVLCEAECASGESVQKILSCTPSIRVTKVSLNNSLIMKAPIRLLTVVICFFMAFTYGQIIIGGGEALVMKPACVHCEAECAPGEVYDKDRKKCVSTRPPITS